MGQHVHVRVRQDLVVSEEGELVEQSGCRCGARWTKTYQVRDADGQ